MGFGYLLLGYLLAFLLEITANAVGAGPLALLVGYGLMAVGIWKLQTYQKSFRLAFPPLALLLVTDVYRMIGMIGEWASKSPAWMTATVTSAVEWSEFALIVCFHSLLLPAVLRLAMSVELPKTAASASRNLILVWMWGILYSVVRLVPFSEEARKVFTVVLTVFNFLFIFLNLFLFLSCMKNIAPEGEDEKPPHRYRWNLLNRIGDRFTREHERAVETSRKDIEEYLRRKKEKKEKREQKKNKK